MFPGRPLSFRYQRRPVDDCSPGRGGMAQDGGTRGETFHCEMDRCRESQGWTMACSNMPERYGKDQGGDIPKEEGPCRFGRPCRLVTRGANLYPPGVWFADVTSSFSVWCYVCFVLFRFHIFAFTEVAAFHSIVSRCACAPTAARSFQTTACCTLFCCSLFFFSLFFFLWRCRFFRVFLYHYRFYLASRSPR